MSTEKYDKQLRENMEAMNTVPAAFSFNPASSWQQLENKLQAKPARKIRWLYWAAASILIILSSMFVLVKEKKQDGMVSTKKQVEKTKDQIVRVKEESIAQKKEPLEQRIQINKQQQPITINPKKQTATVVANDEPIVPASSKNNSTEIKDALATTNENKVDNTVTTTVSNVIQQPTVSKKARMKVVHLNELGQEQQQPVALTNAELKKAMQQRDEINMQPLESTKSWWLFKTKAATSNTSKTINR